MASTLAALDSGAITVAAAAALVIGQNLGTTITAAIGAVGATVPAKRTAVAHIGFNLIAGLVAFAMFPLFEQAVVKMASYAGASNPTTQIAAFHTAFNVLGLLVLLPFFDPFCRAVERLVPGAPRRYTSVLDSSSLKVPAAAVSAIHSALLALLRGAIAFSRKGLDGSFDEAEATVLRDEMQRASKFLLQIVTDSSDDIVHQQHIDALHAMDHIERLIHVVVKPTFYEQASEVDADALVQALRDAYDLVGSEPSSSLVASARDMSQGVAHRRASMREELIHEMAHNGAAEPNEVSDTLRFIVRVDRVLYHLWRGLEHLNGINQRAEELASKN
ncbi:MAG: Na/Pi symporter [bacterium]